MEYNKGLRFKFQLPPSISEENTYLDIKLNAIDEQTQKSHIVEAHKVIIKLYIPFIADFFKESGSVFSDEQNGVVTFNVPNLNAFIYLMDILYRRENKKLYNWKLELEILKIINKFGIEIDILSVFENISVPPEGFDKLMEIINLFKLDKNIKAQIVIRNILPDIMNANILSIKDKITEAFSYPSIICQTDVKEVKIINMFYNEKTIYDECCVESLSADKTGKFYVLSVIDEKKKKKLLIYYSNGYKFNEIELQKQNGVYMAIMSSLDNYIAYESHIYDFNGKIIATLGKINKGKFSYDDHYFCYKSRIKNKLFILDLTTNDTNEITVENEIFDFDLSSTNILAISTKSKIKFYDLTTFQLEDEIDYEYVVSMSWFPYENILAMSDEEQIIIYDYNNSLPYYFKISCDKIQYSYDKNYLLLFV